MVDLHDVQLFVTASEKSMNEGVTQEIASPETKKPNEGSSDKELNFRRLEAAKEAEREARIRAEMQAEAMRNELQEIKQMLQPKESDPLDEVEEYVDPARLRAKLEKERAHLKKEAKEIARQTIREERENEEKRNYLSRLKAQLPDYDQVMNESNIASLQTVDPVFLETALEIPDDYSRRLKVYKKLKSLQDDPKAEERPSIKERVEENAKNPYYIPPTATPGMGAIDFDVRSRSARQQAYDKLKAAQRRPIGNAPAPVK